MYLYPRLARPQLRNDPSRDIGLPLPPFPVSTNSTNGVVYFPFCDASASSPRVPVILSYPKDGALTFAAPRTAPVSPISLSSLYPMGRSNLLLPFQRFHPTGMNVMIS